MLTLEFLHTQNILEISGQDGGVVGPRSSPLLKTFYINAVHFYKKKKNSKRKIRIRHL